MTIAPTRSARRHALSLAAAATAIAAAPSARAEDPLMTAFVSPGVVWSWAGGRMPAHGAGFEISAGAWFKGPRSPPMLTLTNNTLMLGAVYRTQGYDGPGGSYGRRTVAAEIGYAIFGLEVGYATRQATAEGPALSGLHLGPYASMGALYVGTQHVIPTGGVTGPVGFEINLGLKLPLTPLFLAVGMGSFTAGGRPLEVGGRARTAALVRRRDWGSARSNLN